MNKHIKGCLSLDYVRYSEFSSPPPPTPLWISYLCLKMLSFLHMCVYAMLHTFFFLEMVGDRPGDGG